MHKEMTHQHHIIPKHMGGTDDPSNLISLTVQEHAEAHRILFESHGCWQDEVAWKALSGQIGKEEILRLSLKNRKMPPKSEEWKRKMSERMRGENNPRFGKPGTMLGKMMPESAKDTIRHLRSSSWEIITPTGTKEIISNLCEYCREHHLQQTNMVKVSKGIYSQHKGYRCKKLLTVPHK